MSLRDMAKAHKAKAADVSDIPAEAEATVRLHKRATGNHSNQYRGWMDRKGTVRFRVYSTTAPKDFRGSILAGSVEGDATLIDDDEAEATGLIKVEFDGTLEDNSLVVMWAPADADIKKVKVLVS